MVLKHYKSCYLQEKATHLKMAQNDMEELVVRLEESLKLSNMEQRVKLVGSALTNKTLNKWGVKNILKNV